MKKLLLPYAYDSTGNLVHIDNARKNEHYVCPTCGAELILKISKIPEGEKYHRTNHFAHKGGTENHCSESFLHKLFKERTADYIRSKITKKEYPLQFEWECEKCGELHSGNLLKKAVKVIEEYDMQVCRPDIALLDKDNNVVIVIEIVVTHEPTSEVVEFYNENKIACLQIKVTDFDDCKNVEGKLTHPDNMNLCPNPVCQECGHIMNKKKLVIVNDSCWKCSRKMRIAMVESNDYHQIYSPADFTENDIAIANKHGANIKKVFSKTMKESYYANVCECCGSFIGEHYLYEYSHLHHDDEIYLGYECYHCKENKKRKKMEEEIELSRKINEKIKQDGTKVCPKCGSVLRVRKSANGYFYGCKNFPDCKYTENINLD